MASQSFNQDSAGAPDLNGVSGSAVALLDWLFDAARLDWEIVFTATNKRVYRPRAGARMYLRVDDSGAEPREAGVRLFQTMSDIDTGTNQTPTSGQYTGFNIFKSSNSNSTAVKWVAEGDDRGLFLFIRGDSSQFQRWSGFVFCDPVQNDSLENFGTMIGASTGTNPSNWGVGNNPFSNKIQGLNSNNNMFMPTDSQNNGESRPVGAMLYEYGSATSKSFGGTNVGLRYPEPSTSGLIAYQPPWISELETGGAGYSLRGNLPCVWAICADQDTQPIATGTDAVEFAGSGVYAGKQFIAIPMLMGVSFGSGNLIIEKGFER